MKNAKHLKVFDAKTGQGLKALKSFTAGEELIEYLGPRIHSDEANENPNPYLFGLNEDYCIDGSSLSNLARYINHSCTPNAQAVLSHDELSITIEAIKPIEVGDEILIDYGEEYFEAYIAPIGCKCSKCD
ncbi:SET domain-containing protein [Magnetovibrio sp. PR-2]|uniref:SET domain-containing protein n=1 Tax=Magnetovibrio sp. PR-2 TaxID=3120356 RepID=UPI002FCE0C3D